MKRVNVYLKKDGEAAKQHGTNRLIIDNVCSNSFIGEGFLHVYSMYGGENLETMINADEVLTYNEEVNNV